MNEFFGKARRRNGAGTMTKEKQSQRSHSSGTLMDHAVLFHIPQQRSIVSSVLRSGIIQSTFHDRAKLSAGKVFIDKNNPPSITEGGFTHTRRVFSPHMKLSSFISLQALQAE